MFSKDIKNEHWEEMGLGSNSSVTRQKKKNEIKRFLANSTRNPFEKMFKIFLLREYFAIQGNSSVIRQKGESQNGGNKKTKHASVRISGEEILVLRKIWRALFSCYLRFGIRPFALLLTNYLELQNISSKGIF